MDRRLDRFGWFLVQRGDKLCDSDCSGSVVLCLGKVREKFQPRRVPGGSATAPAGGYISADRATLSAFGGFQKHFWESGPVPACSACSKV